VVATEPTLTSQDVSLRVSVCHAEDVLVSSLVCQGCVMAMGLPLLDVLAQPHEAAARQHLPRLGKSACRSQYTLTEPWRE
jgi:hypothetical protein